MDIYETFITKPEKLEKALHAIHAKGIPGKFNKQFLDSLGFEKPNSVLYVNLFRNLELIDEDKKPCQSYSSAFEGSKEQSKEVIGQLVKDKYSEIFEIDELAHELPEERLQDLFREKMGDKKSKTIVRLVSDTFKALCQYAFEETKDNSKKKKNEMEKQPQKIHTNGNTETVDSPHKEFILELINGDRSHEYKNGHITHAADTNEVKEAEQPVNGNAKVAEPASVKKKEVKDQPDNGSQESNDHASSATDNFLLTKALLRRAELLEDLNRQEEAIEAYSDIINYSSQKKFSIGKDNVTNAYYKKASILEKVDRYEDALVAYNELIHQFS